MQADYTLDIRQDVCPMTFVKTKLLLETMHKGQKAAVLLSEGEALENVPVSLKEQGCAVLALEKQPEMDYYILTFQKG